MVQPSNFSEALARLEGRLDRHEDRVGALERYRDEQEVDMDKLMDFMKKRITLEEEREKVQQDQHQQNSAKLDKMNTRQSMGTLIVGGGTLLVGLLELIHILKH